MGSNESRKADTFEVVEYIREGFRHRFGDRMRRLTHVAIILVAFDREAMRSTNSAL